MSRFPLAIPLFLLSIEAEASNSNTGFGDDIEESLNTASGTGDLLFTGSDGAPAESLNTASGTGDLVFTGSGTAAESLNTASGTGATEFAGSGTAAESLNTSSGTGDLLFTGSDGAPAESLNTSSGTGTNWSISQATNLTLLLDGNIGVTTVSSNVSLWADQSGHSNNFAQSSSGNRPPYVNPDTNFGSGNASVHFDGTAGFMSSSAHLSAIVSATEFEVFIVLRVHNYFYDGNTPLGGAIFSDNGFKWGLFTHNTTEIRGFNNDGAGTGTGEYALVTEPIDTTVLINFRKTGNVIYISKNGGAEVSTSAAGDISDLTGTMVLGEWFTGQFFNGYIAYVAACSSNQGSTFRSSTISNLKDRFGI